jgi:hypothetical protein
MFRDKNILRIILRGFEGRNGNQKIYIVIFIVELSTNRKLRKAYVP